MTDLNAKRRREWRIFSVLINVHCLLNTVHSLSESEKQYLRHGTDPRKVGHLLVDVTGIALSPMQARERQ
jgi:hypothetical protein